MLTNFLGGTFSNRSTGSTCLKERQAPPRRTATNGTFWTHSRLSISIKMPHQQPDATNGRIRQPEVTSWNYRKWENGMASILSPHSICQKV